MDNQHVSIDTHELAWFAGCIECDGSIAISFYSKGKTGIKPQCVITFCNTGEIMHRRVSQVLKALNVNPHIRMLTPRKDRENCKPVLQIEVQSQSKCKRVLEAIRPYLEYKLPQADTVLKFVASRMSRGAKQGIRLPFTKEELQLVYNIRVMNQKGTSQTEDRDLVLAIANAQ